MRLLSVSEAQERLVQVLPEPGVEAVSLQQSLGRILAEDIRTVTPIPEFANSSMDGFAVRAADLADASPSHPVALRVVGDIPAGIAPEFTLEPGQAARIMTGAQVPAGADVVVPVEDTDFKVRVGDAQIPQVVHILRSLSPGAYIRKQGEDLAGNVIVLKKGRKLRAVDIGMIAMLGRADVLVFRKPLIGVLSTGDELVAPGEELLPGQKYESNSYTLLAAIESAGGTGIRLGVARDTFASVAEKLDQAVEYPVDLIVTSAGVSVGAYDYVREVIEKNGELDFWRVNMRPGKPLAFGRYRDVPVIGLPGNPVSSFVGFEIFVRPAMNYLLGVSPFTRELLEGMLTEPVESDGRESYLRAIFNRDPAGQIEVRLTGHQGSGNQFSLVMANGLIVIPAGVTSLPAGSVVKILPIA